MHVRGLIISCVISVALQKIQTILEIRYIISQQIMNQQILKLSLIYMVVPILCIDFPLKGNIYRKSCKVTKKYNCNNI